MNPTNPEAMSAPDGYDSRLRSLLALEASGRFPLTTALGMPVDKFVEWVGPNGTPEQAIQSFEDDLRRRTLRLVHADPLFFIQALTNHSALHH